MFTDKPIKKIYLISILLGLLIFIINIIDKVCSFYHVFIALGCVLLIFYSVYVRVNYYEKQKIKFYLLKKEFEGTNIYLITKSFIILIWGLTLYLYGVNSHRNENLDLISITVFLLLGLNLLIFVKISKIKNTNGLDMR